MFTHASTAQPTVTLRRENRNVGVGQRASAGLLLIDDYVAWWMSISVAPYLACRAFGIRVARNGSGNIADIAF
jgi:hypothetical protein